MTKGGPGGGSTVAFQTFGCKANQYDTERMRQELEARGASSVADWREAGVCVVNTCTVTNQADADARRFIRKVRRENPGVRIVVAGCSAALRAPEYRANPAVDGVIEGHDPVRVAEAAGVVGGGPGGVHGGVHGGGAGAGGLVQIGLPRSREAPDASGSRDGGGPSRSLDRMDSEPVGAEILLRRDGATRGWLKVQDGCDRKCSFCATRLARGSSRSRCPDEIVREARALSRTHPELVITGIHIGHYGLDLDPALSLGRLVARLLDEVPGPRFRLGSVEATEIDDLLLDLMTTSGSRLAPHLHMPLQSGADPVLRRMRRWHTREMYRVRALEIAEKFDFLGLGADIITGFPGETEEDHRATVELVEELPYTYLHVFPFSPREGTVAADLVRDMPVPQRLAGERARELRELVQARGEAYRRARAGSRARVVLEGKGRSALTEDYLRVGVKGPLPDDHRGIHDAELAMVDGELSAVFGTG